MAPKKAASADWHIQQAKEALEKSEQLRDDLKRSCRSDKGECDKRFNQMQALQRGIADTKARIDARNFVIKAATEMKQSPKTAGKAYLTTTKAKQNQQEEFLKGLQKQLAESETSWTQYSDARNEGRKDRLEKLVKDVHRVQFHAMQAGNLEAPTEKVLSLLRKSEELLIGPYQPSTKFPMWGRMWKQKRRDYTIAPKYWKE